MKNIRPFQRDDITQVSELHAKVFGDSENGFARMPPAERLKRYTSYFERYFLSNPWYDEAIPSLVYQDASGRVIGFLGVFQRRMRFKGEPITMALSSQFVVDPERRATTAGLALLKTFLNGPQDLSITDEANSTSRKIWESMGGKTALILSIQWKRIIRPGFYAGNVLRDRKSWMHHLSGLKPFFSLTDRYLTEKFPHRYTILMPEGTTEDLDIDTYLRCLDELSSVTSLLPDYDRYSLGWMIDSLEQKRRLGKLRRKVVRNVKNEIIGWFFYYLKPHGTSSSVQIMAKKNHYGVVIDHLFHDVWQNGSTSISGRMKPAFMQTLSERYCSYHCGAPWVMTYSHNPELLLAIHEDNSLLSRMEGELCLHFADGLDLP